MFLIIKWSKCLCNHKLNNPKIIKNKINLNNKLTAKFGSVLDPKTNKLQIKAIALIATFRKYKLKKYLGKSLI